MDRARDRVGWIILGWLIIESPLPQLGVDVDHNPTRKQGILPGELTLAQRLVALRVGWSLLTDFDAMQRAGVPILRSLNIQFRL